MLYHSSAIVLGYLWVDAVCNANPISLTQHSLAFLLHKSLPQLILPPFFFAFDTLHLSQQSHRPNFETDPALTLKKLVMGSSALRIWTW